MKILPKKKCSTFAGNIRFERWSSRSLYTSSYTHTRTELCTEANFIRLLVRTKTYFVSPHGNACAFRGQRYRTKHSSGCLNENFINSLSMGNFIHCCCTAARSFERGSHATLVKRCLFRYEKSYRHALTTFAWNCLAKASFSYLFSCLNFSHTLFREILSILLGGLTLRTRLLTGHHTQI